MGKIVLIASGKGGVGKTTITACLGKVLAKQGSSVLLVEGTFGLRNLDILLEVETKVFSTSRDVMKKRVPLSEAVITHPCISNLYYLPVSQLHEATAEDRELFQKLLEEAEKQFDYILIDGTSGVDLNTKVILPKKGRVLLVTNLSDASLRGAGRVQSFVEQHAPGVQLYLLLNQVARPKSEQETQDILYSLAEILSPTVIDWIPPLEEPSKMVDEDTSIWESLGRAVSQNEPATILPVFEKKRGLLEKIKSHFH